MHPTSGDAALLDLFCIQENEDDPTDCTKPLNPPMPEISAGRLNLNTRNWKGIAAALCGTLKDQDSILGPVLSNNIAKELVNWTHADPSDAANKGKSPLSNISELVGTYTTGTGGVIEQGYAGFSSYLPSLFAAASVHSVASRITSVVRALSDVGQTRTWNLMIDVIAQTGRYPQSASGLDQFLVEGEKRYWVHVAIDRITGQVIDQLWEPVSE